MWSRLIDTGALVDHDVIDTTQFLAGRIVDCRAIDFAGGDEATAGVGGINFSHKFLLKSPPLVGFGGRAINARFGFGLLTSQPTSGSFGQQSRGGPVL